MSDEQNTSLDDTPEAGKNQPNQEQKQQISQKSVLHYLLILFAAAFCLLILTLLMEQRTNDEIVDTLSDQVLYAQSIHTEASSQRDQLADELALAQAEIDALEEAINNLMDSYNQDTQSLQQQLDEANAQIAALEEALAALEPETEADGTSETDD